MGASSSYVRGPSDLESVIATDQLRVRPSRQPNQAKETEALIKLHRQLSESPQDFFQKLTNVALELVYADSTGVSLLHEEAKCFVWPAVSGPLDPFLWEGTPQEFGPCGTVLERDRALLMLHPEKHFDYLTPIWPPLEEVLLIPFYVNKKAVGTLWAVIHAKGKYFDAEDKRLLESLSIFASSAYDTLVKTGGLAPLLTNAKRRSS